MPLADIGNLRLYYEEHGSGEPLIFLHGFTLDRRMWADQVSYFRSSYRVIVVDARGHGKSDAPESGYSRGHRVEDLERFADQLGLERFHLVGLSMGGSTAIGYALKNQKRLLSMILVSTGAAGYDIGKKYAKFDRLAQEHGLESVRNAWKAMTLSWYGDRLPEVRELMTQMIDDHSGAVWLDPMRGKYKSMVDLEVVHTIAVPTCIIAGDRDRIFVPLAEELHRRIKESQFLLYKGIGHMVNLEAPDRFNADLSSFLDSVKV